MSHSVQEHRRRLAARGIKRVEISVPQGDAEMLRRVAKVLSRDDDTADGLRAAIERHVPDRPAISFKEWLQTAD